MSRQFSGMAVLAVLVCFAGGAAAQQPPPAVSRWPVQVLTAEGQVTIFQPQLEDFQPDQLRSRAAVSVALNGQAQPVFGAVWLHDRIAVNPDARTIQVLQVDVARVRLESADPAAERAVDDAVRQYFGGRDIVLNLAQVQATLDILHKEQAAEAQIQFAPPAIIFRDHPAVKVQYDGPPRMVAVADSRILRAVNTPFFVALDPNSRTYFLKGGGRWFAAPDARGPFHKVSTVPADVAALAAASGYQDPQQPLNIDPSVPIEIVTATDPTELIWTNGPVQMAQIPGTNLLYASNTDSDLFLSLSSPHYFVLVSGRWYSAPKQDGPWTFVPPQSLPDDFRRIPPDSPKGGVLVSVPGTQAAADAAADAWVPRTAAVDLTHFDQPPVAYDGDPDFEPIAGADMSYAVNTSASVLLVGGQYFCCDNAVWYVSGAAAGPWEICTAVPAEIYTIPPSCPIYPVRFVYIYGFGPGVVYCDYLPGYVGSFVYDGVVVFGTGYRYRPWFGHFYVGRPFTYGFSAHYDWAGGRWGFDFAAALGGGGGWFVAAGDHRPHGDWFGYGGFRPVFARDRAHVAVAEHEFAEDRAHQGVAAGVYDWRADVHADSRGEPLHPDSDRDRQLRQDRDSQDRGGGRQQQSPQGQARQQ